MSKGSRSATLSASIVIVAWRLVDELRECLDSIHESIDAPSHEVIVVLNGASDATAEVANSHPAVTRVITRQANVGFGAGCNVAASVATGENLVFLNDDTRVDPYWLRSIVAASAQHPVVASLLLNYDGTVQEAGSRLLSHGGTVQLGKGAKLEAANESGLLLARPVDYGSAAALLVRRSAFEEVGGFDPIFEPAYFEDVDLQLRLRQRGIDVWFEPSAKVLHHSGQSTRADHWFRQFAANRSGYRFIERWTDVLATAPAVDSPLEQLCEVPRQSGRSTEREPLDASLDDSPTRALVIARDYEAWLATQLDQFSDYHAEISVNPLAPNRKELLDQLHSLRVRVSDLERRGPLGVVRMRAGVWLTRRRREQ